MKDLLAAIVLTGAYSFIMANVWLQLGACDVAFTEAAVRGRCLHSPDDGLFIESAEVGEGMRSPTMKPLTWMGLLVAITPDRSIPIRS